MDNAVRMEYREQIEELAAASRRLGELGYVTSHGGNLSCRVAQNRVLITPTKVVKRTLTPEDVCITDMDGKLLWAAEGRKPTGETPMHLRIYRKRPDAVSVVHAHPPILTGFSISGSAHLLAKPLLPEPVIEAGPVVLVEYAEPISEDLAEKFDSVLHRSNAFLMKNHGMTVCSSEGVSRALDVLEMLEMEAYSVWVAKTLGTVDSIPVDEVEKMERTLKTRSLPLPGDPRHVKRLVDQYR
ncbi:MAG: class II aldolase/adducin family protein [Alkalispirochaetaceae bacterium]